MDSLYILIDRIPKPIEEVLEWADWMEQHKKDCIVGKFQHRSEPIEVSTIFLGIDTNPLRGGAPRVFETAVFDGRKGKDSVSIYRYSSWDEAKAGHDQIVDSL